VSLNAWDGKTPRRLICGRPIAIGPEQLINRRIFLQTPRFHSKLSRIIAAYAAVSDFNGRPVCFASFGTNNNRD
jgi:hypothetical protein